LDTSSTKPHIFAPYELGTGAGWRPYSIEPLLPRVPGCGFQGSIWLGGIIARAVLLSTLLISFPCTAVSFQVELAIRALLQYDKKQDNKELLSGDGFIWVQCAFKKTPALHKSAKQL